MVLTKLVKCIIHVNDENGELRYSFWSCGDYTSYEEAKCNVQNWCNEMNKEESYKKFSCEVVNLYGEATKW